MKNEKKAHKQLSGADNVYLTRNYVVKQVIKNKTDHRNSSRANYEITNTYLPRTPELVQVSRFYTADGKAVRIVGAKVKSKIKGGRL